VVKVAIELADASGLDSVTIRALGDALGISTMSVYTHVNSRDDLLVLMVDQAHSDMTLSLFARTGWRTRVRRVADANLTLYRSHPWLLLVSDPRVVLGPGTIAKYDHELHIFDGTALDDLTRDAAVTFVLDFVRAGAAAMLNAPPPGGFDDVWADAVDRLGSYVGSDFALARRVGTAAGESMGEPFSAERAWHFGVDRVIAGLADIVEPRTVGGR
jgi:AcrR family transcriptional regulator